MRIQDALMGVGGLILFPILLVIGALIMCTALVLLFILMGVAGIIEIADLITFKRFKLADKVEKYLESKTSEAVR